MIYIVTSTTTNVPNLSTGPVMGVHGSLKEANAHMSMCVEAALTGGKLCWDISSKGGDIGSECSFRRAMISLDGSGSTVIAIEGWDIRRAKRTKESVEPSAVLAAALSNLAGEEFKTDVEDLIANQPTQAMVDLVNGVDDLEDAPNI